MKSTAEGLRQRTAEPAPAARHVDQAAFRGEENYSVKLAEDSPMFSPLPFYFRDQNVVQEKRGEKTLIGEGGWLERTDKDLDKETKKNGTKKLGIWDGFKKIAKDMTDLQGKRFQSTVAREPAYQTELSISLDAREQSLLYGELEYHLNSALNTFITQQLEKGRLATDKLKKVADAWLTQGRPRVVGFRYDLETQLELVMLHSEPTAGNIGGGCYFVFSGRRQGNPSEILGLLQTMRVNARAMRIRTYCQPDSVIAKQLVDSRNLFDTLGVDKNLNKCLGEIVDFYEVCRGREEEKRKRERERAARERMKHDNIERWERDRAHQMYYADDVKAQHGGGRYSEEHPRWI